MKSKLVLLIASILLLSMSHFTFAQTSERTTIRVGYDGNYGVLDDISSLDSKGFGYEILMRAEHYSNFDFEFVEYEYFDLFEALDKNEIDMMGIMFSSEYYSEKYELVPKTLGTAQLILATKDSTPYYDDPASIDGKVVASYENNPYEEYLNDYCEENGITVSYVRDSIDTFIDLEADLYLVTTLDQNTKDLSMVMNFDVFDMFFLTNKDNSALAEEIAKAIELSVSADGTFLEELQIEYFGLKNLTRRYLTVDEIALLKSKTLTCGYIDHHQPIQYVNELGEADGISVQIMDILADTHGFDVEYVAYNHDMPNESHENFDILISATGDFEHEMEFYTPTEPFLDLPLMLFAEKDDIDDIVSENHTSKLGILNYITIDHEFVEERYPSNVIVNYDTFDELLGYFMQGEIDGFFATDIGVEYAQTILGEEDYAINSTELELPLRVFVSNDDEHLTQYIGAFNVMFEHLDQNAIDKVMSTQSVAFFPEYSVSEFLSENALVLAIIIVLILLIVAIGIFYAQYKRKKAVLDIINYDKLTKLHSKYYFDTKATETLQTAKPNEFEIISLDIDSFNTINQIYSQEKGNAVLKVFADTLKDSYRFADAVVTRVIADEFLVFHRVKDNISTKQLVEQALNAAVKSIMGEKYNVSVSVGSYIIHDTTKTIRSAVDCAVAARIKGKHIYGFTFNNFNDDIRKENELKSNIVLHMKGALQNNEFRVVYQPKINLKTLKVGGAEALVRWHSKNEVIPPNVFIGIFESNGFIVNLDRFIFEQVCIFIKTNKDKMNIPIISVNASTVTLFDETFPSEYEKILKRHGVLSKEIEIEITESAMVIEQSILIQKIDEIRKLGFQLSIDDFGAGESSLNRLSTVTADIVKLDKAFFDDYDTDERGAIVIKNAIRLVKELDMKVVSEGVETKQLARWLKSLECDYAQGYFFEKPMSENDFKALLISDKQYELKE